MDVVPVASLAALQNLAGAEDPREIVVVAIDAVRNAPEYLIRLAEKTDMGWTCGQEMKVHKVARLAELLFEVGNITVPALQDDPSNGDMVRRLGYQGKRIRDLGSRSKPHTPFAVVHLARPLGNILRASARQVIKGDKPPAWLVDHLDLIAVRIEASLDSNVNMEALRTARIASLGDLRNLLDVEEPRDIHLVSVDAVRNAPEYLDVVLQKTALGWTCDQEERLRKVVRFATLLTEIADVILPALKANAGKRKTIQRLRSRGQKLVLVKRRAPAEVAALAGPLANWITAAARSVLAGANTPAWLADRLDAMAAQVQVCLGSSIRMEDDESEEEPHHLPPPNN